MPSTPPLTLQCCWPLVGCCVDPLSGGHLRPGPCLSLSFLMGGILVPQTSESTLASASLMSHDLRTVVGEQQGNDLGATCPAHGVRMLKLAPYFIAVQPDQNFGFQDNSYFMSYLCTFTLYLLGCSHPCSSHIFWPREHFLISFVSFVHVVWPCGFAVGYLQVTCLHDAEWAPVLSFHVKEPVSHLPMRHRTGSCFACPFLSHS